jgi:uncharacterized LabA/DUF88 family protein
VEKRYSILIDGGFFVRKLQQKLKARPTIEDVVLGIQEIQNHKMFEGFDLLRIYYYDARPASGKLKNPISRKETDLAQTEVFKRNQSFLDALELKPNIALRLGEVSANGWKLTRTALEDDTLPTRKLTSDDFGMDLEQKGVDLRIGLDIARLSIGRLVHSLLVVTGDSDMVPAFKFARREGVRVILSHMGHGIKRELRAHADLILEEMT